jgi:hypothetical protein
VKTSTRLFAVAAVLVACVVPWSGTNSPAQEKKEDKGKGGGSALVVSKWEYKVTTLGPRDRDADTEKELNKLGEDGWELVGTPSSVTAPQQAEGNQGNPGISTKVKLIFKRAKR